MTHRPYPNPARARHQLARHDDETPPRAEPRPMTPFEQQLAANAERVQEALRPRLQGIAASLLAAFQPRPMSGEEASKP